MKHVESGTIEKFGWQFDTRYLPRDEEKVSDFHNFMTFKCEIDKTMASLLMKLFLRTFWKGTLHFK